MHAATLDRLKRDTHFQPEQAVAIAEAIDMAIVDNQLVTIPVFEARLTRVETRLDGIQATMDARFEALKTEIDAKFTALKMEMEVKFPALRTEMHTEFAALRTEMRAGFAKMEARFEAQEARFAAQDAKFEAKFEAQDAKFDAKLSSLKAHLTIIILAATLGSPAIPMITTALINAIHKFL